MPLPLTCRVSAEKSTGSLMGIPLYVICGFSLAAFNTLSLSLFFVILFTMSLDMFLFGLALYGTLCASWLGTVSFPGLRKFSAIISSNIFSAPFSLLLWDPYETNISALYVVPGSLKFCPHFFSFFFLFPIQWQSFHYFIFQFADPFHCITSVSSVQLLSPLWLFVTPWTAARQAPCPSPTPGACLNSCPSSHWFHPSHPLLLLCHLAVCWFLLLYFFISVIIFLISARLFFVFSNSLLKTSNFSFCASILLSSSLIIFAITTLNSLLGRLSISTLLSSSSEVLSYSCVWNMFLCCIILPELLFVFLCIWWKCESESHSGVSSSLRPQGLYSPWNSPGQNAGVGSLSLLQGIFSTQGLNPSLPHW